MEHWSLQLRTTHQFASGIDAYLLVQILSDYEDDLIVASNGVAIPTAMQMMDFAHGCDLFQL
jgi:hypothetical protein